MNCNNMTWFGKVLHFFFFFYYVWHRLEFCIICMRYGVIGHESLCCVVIFRSSDMCSPFFCIGRFGSCGMAQAPEPSQLVALRDPCFSLKDGLRITSTAVDQISDSGEVSQESESFISPKSISRLLIERGEYSAVPIYFQHFSKAAAGWSEWVNSELESGSRKTIVEAGLAVPLLLSGFCEIFRDDVCLWHMVRRWSPQTHTFVCSWGEFTPTLEDVYNIMRLPITGDTDPFDLPLDEGLEKNSSRGH